MMRMPARFTVAVLVLLFVAAGEAAPAEKNGSKRLLVDTFDLCLDAKTSLPCGWKATRTDVSMYSLERENGNSYVKIRSRHGYTAIGKQVGSRGSGMRYLHWQWRAHVLPVGAREDEKKNADSGAGVYVVFKGPLGLNTIVKYVWSTTLPSGTVTRSPYSSRTKIMVKRSGSDLLGTWVEEKADVLDDYERLFSAPPPEIVAIGIMSDADNTKSYAEADYDNFYFEEP